MYQMPKLKIRAYTIISMLWGKNVRITPILGKDVFKIHYATPNWLPGTRRCQFMCHCTGDSIVRHDPPLLYNIARDPSEIRPLSPTDPTNAKTIRLIDEAVGEHLRGVESVPSQYTFGKMVPRPWLQPCCNFPFCDCVDPVYAHLSKKR